MQRDGGEDARAAVIRRDRLRPRRATAVLALLAVVIAASLAGRRSHADDRPSPHDLATGSVYRSLAAGRDADLDSLLGARLDLVLTINRIDREHAATAGSLVVPRAESSLAALSPFPDTLPSAAGVTKLIVVSVRVQAFAAYACGRRERWGAVSTGREATPTPPGVFHTQWQSRLRASTIDPDWLMPWYWNLDNRRGLSMHAYALPGYPASHGCIRLSEPDARWFFDWAEGYIVTPDGREVLRQGTPVVVFGVYDFAAPAPWRRLARDPEATTIPARELDDLVRRSLAPAAREPVAEGPLSDGRQYD